MAVDTERAQPRRAPLDQGGRRAQRAQHGDGGAASGGGSGERGAVKNALKAEVPVRAANLRAGGGRVGERSFSRADASR